MTSRLHQKKKKGKKRKGKRRSKTFETKAIRIFEDSRFWQPRDRSISRSIADECGAQSEDSNDPFESLAERVMIRCVKDTHSVRRSPPWSPLFCRLIADSRWESLYLLIAGPERVALLYGRVKYLVSLYRLDKQSVNNPGNSNGTDSGQRGCALPVSTPRPTDASPSTTTPENESKWPARTTRFRPRKQIHDVK
ncbi:hypothetical protein HN011_002594 [Eciton burchellii]|nr:hypothetical protein HN011_002594 [Eciton burchellii]